MHSTRPWTATLVVCLGGATLMMLSGATSAADDSVSVWHRWEATFEADADPDTQLTVVLSGPDGTNHQIDGFWDGGRTWRVRFMPDRQGTWKYRTTSKPARDGLDAQRGQFVCGEPSGETRFQQHGPVRVSVDGRYFEHTDGTPFLWIVDTAWNGALKSTADMRARSISFLGAPAARIAKVSASYIHGCP